VTWERLLNIERYQQVTKEGYILPAGANVISSTQELTYKEIKNTIEKCSQKQEDVPSHKEYSHTNTQVEEDGTVKKKDIYRVVYKKEVKNYCWEEVQVQKIPEYRTKYIYSIWEWILMPSLKNFWRRFI